MDLSIELGLGSSIFLVPHSLALVNQLHFDYRVSREVLDLV
jgi:hypothetical protein